MDINDIESQFSANLTDESTWTEQEKKLIDDEKNKAPKFRLNEYRKDPIPYLTKKQKYLAYIIKQTKAAIKELKALPFASNEHDQQREVNEAKLAIYEKDLESLKEKIETKSNKKSNKDNRSKKLEHFKKHSKIAKGAGILKGIANGDIKGLYKMATEDKTLAWESKVEVHKSNIITKANKWNAYKKKHPNDKIVKDILKELNECLDLQNKINKERGLEKVNLKTLIAEIKSKPLNDIIAKKFGDKVLKTADELKPDAPVQEKPASTPTTDNNVIEGVDTKTVEKVEKRVSQVETSVKDIEEYITDPDSDKSDKKTTKKTDAGKVDEQNVNDTINKLNNKLGIKGDATPDSFKKDDVKSLLKNTTVMKDKLTYIAKRLGPKQDTSIDKVEKKPTKKKTKSKVGKGKKQKKDGLSLLSMIDGVDDIKDLFTNRRRRFAKDLRRARSTDFNASMGFNRAVLRLIRRNNKKLGRKGAGGLPGFDGPDKDGKDNKGANKTKGAGFKKAGKFGMVASALSFVGLDLPDFGGDDETKEKPKQKPTKKARVLPKMGGKTSGGFKNFAKGLGKGAGKLVGGATSWIAGLGIAIGAVFVGLDIMAIEDAMSKIFGPEYKNRLEVIAKSVTALGTSQFSWIWGGSPEEDFVTYVIGSEKMTLKQFQTALGYISPGEDKFDIIIAERMKNFGAKDPAVMEYGKESLKNFSKSKTRISKGKDGSVTKETTTMAFKDKDNKAILDKISKSSSGSVIWDAMHDADVIHEDSDIGKNDVHIEDEKHLEAFLKVYLDKQQRKTLTDEISKRITNKDIVGADGNKIIALIKKVENEIANPVQQNFDAINMAQIKAAREAQTTHRQTNTQQTVNASLGDEGNVAGVEASNTNNFEVKKVTGPTGGTSGSEDVDISKVDSSEVFHNPTNENLDGVDPNFLHNLKAMGAEYEAIYGHKMQVNSGFRSIEEQAELKKKYPGKAATPGKSMHNHGFAIDMQSKHNDNAIKAGLFKKYGMDRPVKTRKGLETWHVEPKGINRAAIRENGMKKYKSSLAKGKQTTKAPENVKAETSASDVATVASKTNVKPIKAPKGGDEKATARQQVKEVEKVALSQPNLNVREKTDFNVTLDGVQLRNLQKAEQKELDKIRADMSKAMQANNWDLIELAEEKQAAFVAKVQKAQKAEATRNQAKAMLDVKSLNGPVEAKPVEQPNKVNTQAQLATNTGVVAPVATPKVTENTTVTASVQKNLVQPEPQKETLSPSQTASLINHAIAGNKIDEPISVLGTTQARKS